MDNKKFLQKLKKNGKIPFNYQNISILVDKDNLDSVRLVKNVNVNIYHTDKYLVGDFYKPISQIIDFSDLIKK